MDISPGCTVLYTVTASQANAVNKRRSDAVRFPNPETGQIIHVGNEVREGDVFPLVVVRVWVGNRVNGQLFLDGNDHLWITSASEGAGPGFWFWPPRV
jgi:hypothetical protein